jgi:hypothetical protein
MSEAGIRAAVVAERREQVDLYSSLTESGLGRPEPVRGLART